MDDGARSHAALPEGLASTRPELRDVTPPTLLQAKYLAVPDTRGVYHVVEVHEIRARLSYASRVCDFAVRAEYVTGPASFTATGRHDVSEVAGVFIERAVPLGEHEAARHVHGWQTAREQARFQQHSFYDGIVIGDPARQTVQQMDQPSAHRQSVQLVSDKHRASTHGHQLEP